MKTYPWESDPWGYSVAVIPVEKLMTRNQLEAVGKPDGMRKRLAELFGRQPSDALVQLIEAELATATQQALEAARAKVVEIAQVVGKRVAQYAEDERKVFVMQQIDGILMDTAEAIRALTTADIAAKAKEREEQGAALLTSADRDLQSYVNALGEAEQRERQAAAKAYLRCADELDGDPNNLAHRFIETFRKWANEADGGEK
jgi:hypothetical protein